MTADAEAYAIEKEAEAGRKAAETRYHTRVREAEADLQAVKLRAEGRKAEDAIALDTEKERVLILREELQARDEFSSAGIDLDLRRLQIEKNSEVQTALAGALGTLTKDAKMTFYGSADMLGSMVSGLSKSLEAASFVQGVASASLDGDTPLHDEHTAKVMEAASVLAKTVSRGQT